MAKHYQDFVGLNTFVYEPVGADPFYPNGSVLIGPSEELTIPKVFGLGLVTEDGLSGFNQNHIGVYGVITDSSFILGSDPSLISNIHRFKNYDFSHNLPTTASFFNALMSKRGNVYGYPIWRQLRASQNPLIRNQRKNNIFTYVQEPGPLLGSKRSRYGAIRVFQESVVSTAKPLSLIGEVSLYNDNLGAFEKKSVEIKTSFGNEVQFFANKPINEHFNTIFQTDENYEALKEMYLDGGLEDEGSFLDSFSLLTYNQTIWPKQQYAYLDRTRSRKYYVNTFWRDLREDRTQTNLDNGFGSTIPSQSMWPLDVAVDWETRGTPIIRFFDSLKHKLFSSYIGGEVGARYDSGGLSGFNTGDDASAIAGDATITLGGEGLLMNSYSTFTRGLYDTTNTNEAVLNFTSSAQDLAANALSASCIYSRRHAINNIESVVSPSGMNIQETGSLTSIATDSLFEGMAAWDAWKEKGHKPFYDSYDDFAQELRAKGKGYSIIPEFRVSSHVETYEIQGITEELAEIFEISGALSQNTTTSNEDSFYKVLSNTDFLSQFDIIKKDHKDFAEEKIITLKCKGLKKFLPYEGFYPAQRSVDLAKRFVDSYSQNFNLVFDGFSSSSVSTSLKNNPIMEPLFAPGILFNTIKSGVAVDFPIIIRDHDPSFARFNKDATISNLSDRYNYMITNSSQFPDPQGATIPQKIISSLTSNWRSIFSQRVPFEALVDPAKYLSGVDLKSQNPHPFGLADIDYSTSWDGQGDQLFSKMSNNFLAESIDFFMKDGELSSIASLEEQNPAFGNAQSGSFYAMRIKMKRSRNKNNDFLGGIGGTKVIPPQDNYGRLGVQENFTMYSRPTSFGPPVWGGPQSGTFWGSYITNPLGDNYGNNYCYTPPYYYGESWCDVIFECTASRKYTLDEIISEAREYPYYTRFWWPGMNDALRDATGYKNDSTTTRPGKQSLYFTYETSPWRNLVDITGLYVSGAYFPEAHSWGDNTDTTVNDYGNNSIGWKNCYGRAEDSLAVDEILSIPQHPTTINYNAMHVNSSINLFGKGTVREVRNKDTGETSEVASADTVRGKTRWIIQSKFETPMLNFNKYTNLEDHDLTTPSFASESVPRGMWHQYGEIPEDPNVGVFLQVDDIPLNWMKGAFGINKGLYEKRVKSLADLVGFSKDSIKLGQVSTVKEISECVVAVPFIEKDATRKFFSIPRVDIDSCISASKREIDGNFPAGGPPKAGDTVYQMVKKMQKYVFPPSMDFVRYKEIDPFAMYIFEFKHNLTKQDLADIWQNLPPEIGTKIEEAEASISHELLAAELLGDGAIVNNGVLDKNAEGNGIPSNIQWMVFKVKKRAKTNYYDKVIAKKGTTDETSAVEFQGITNSVDGSRDKEITYNWPYDFFSLVELVKIDAEISFANIENDDKGQKSIKKVESKKTRKPSMINKARGKGRTE